MLELYGISRFIFLFNPVRINPSIQRISNPFNRQWKLLVLIKLLNDLRPLVSPRIHGNGIIQMEAPIQGLQVDGLIDVVKK